MSMLLLDVCVPKYVELLAAFSELALKEVLNLLDLLHEQTDPLAHQLLSHQPLYHKLTGIIAIKYSIRLVPRF
jgi:hypothetical protein